ncbi:MAG: hypothetical protein KF857_06875 [Fimbriimonadaceae bacterium]|nr:hypothetical protein [Fimbriimonadaceae bacterium]
MNRPQQALVGALAGALAVLNLHPATRPFLLRPLMPRPSSVLAGALPSGEAQQRLFIYEKAFAPGQRSTDDLLTIAEAAQRMGDVERQNAVWPVLEAWSQDRLDNQEAAERAWHEASTRSKWDDVAPPPASGDDSAWDLYRRDAALGPGFAQAFLGYVNRLSLDKPGEDGARWETVQIGVTGWRASERYAAKAAFREGMEAALRHGKAPQVLDTARTQLSAGQYRVLSEALADSDLSSRRQERFALEALLAGRLAGGALVAGVAGALLFGVGSLLAASGRARAVFALPWCAVIGGCLAVAVFAATRLVFPSLWAAVVWGGFGVVRDRIWRGEPAELGRLFPGVVTVLAVLFVASVSLLVGLADPGLPSLHDQTALVNDAEVIMGVARGTALFWLSLVLVAAQVFAFVRRRAPALVGARALGRFGLTSLVAGLVFAVVLTPVGLAWDTRLRHVIQSGTVLD